MGGACFICPGLAVIIALAAVFLAGNPPTAVRGAALGAGAAVAPVALNAAIGLAPASWRRSGTTRDRRARWVVYAAVGAASAATVGTYLVLVLVGCGLVELAVGGALRPPGGAAGVIALVPPRVAASRIMSPSRIAAAPGGLGALSWVALKVGALSFGGGFVIIPLMQADAVHRYHWMTNAQFLNAVALGQITPGPVVQTVAVVGYAAAGVGGALLAAFIVFAPSFAFILGGARHFSALAIQPAGPIVPRGRGSRRRRRHRRCRHPPGAGDLTCLAGR